MFIWYSQINKKRNQKKFVYFGQGIAFENDFGDDFARNIVIFGVNNTASIHNRKCKNNFLMLDEGLTDDINDSVGTADKKIALPLLNQMQTFLWVSITMVTWVIKPKTANVKSLSHSIIT